MVESLLIAWIRSGRSNKSIGSRKYSSVRIDCVLWGRSRLWALSSLELLAPCLEIPRELCQTVQSPVPWCSPGGFSEEIQDSVFWVTKWSWERQGQSHKILSYVDLWWEKQSFETVDLVFPLFSPISLPLPPTLSVWGFFNNSFLLFWHVSMAW